MELDEQPPGSIPPVKMLAGNKCDLANSRQVASVEGLAWARAHNCGFMETSARNVVNIEETFECRSFNIFRTSQAVKTNRNLVLVRRVVAAREDAARGIIAPRPQRANRTSTGSEEKNGEFTPAPHYTDPPKRTPFTAAFSPCCVIS